jgi:hypothetical protein
MYIVPSSHHAPQRKIIGNWYGSTGVCGAGHYDHNHAMYMPLPTHIYMHTHTLSLSLVLFRSIAAKKIWNRASETESVPPYRGLDVPSKIREFPWVVSFD